MGRWTLSIWLLLVAAVVVCRLDQTRQQVAAVRAVC
jgi:hypothetical protein